jgi:hypothetical protein
MDPFIKIITGCSDCPCCDMNDFCSGYTCKIDKKERIKEDENGIEITPDWCIIKKGPLTIKYK